MSDQELRITTFNNLFNDFLNDLSILYPNDATLNLCKACISTTLIFDNKFIINEFKKTILQYQEHILSKNEAYFLDHTFKENFNDDDFIKNEINKIVNIWKDPKTDEATKKKTWNYMIKLVKLAKTIL